MPHRHPSRGRRLTGLLAGALLVVLPGAPVLAKPEAPLRIAATSTGALRINAPLTVTLSFRTSQGGQPVAVRYATEGGVVLQSRASAQLTTDANGQASDTLSLTATRDGDHFLNVFATVGGRTRAVSVPLSAGTAGGRESPKSLPGAAAAPAGAFVEFEADETVH